MSNADRATRTIRGYQRRDHTAGCRMVDPYDREPFWNLTRIGCTMVAAALVTPFLAPSYFREPDVQPASEIARLVGTGCGPDRLTLYAIEESDFPRCDVIDTPENLCGAGYNAPDCAARLGETR